MGTALVPELEDAVIIDHRLGEGWAGQRQEEQEGGARDHHAEATWVVVWVYYLQTELDGHLVTISRLSDVTCPSSRCTAWTQTQAFGLRGLHCGLSACLAGERAEQVGLPTHPELSWGLTGRGR